MTAKDVAIHALRTTPIRQCVGSGIMFDEHSVMAMCAFNLIQTAFAETGDKWGSLSRFPGALIYANDRLGLTFDEIADLIEQDVITIDMSFSDAEAFVEAHPIRRADQRVFIMRSRWSELVSA
jgi:hypothetical protein